MGAVLAQLQSTFLVVGGWSLDRRRRKVYNPRVLKYDVGSGQMIKTTIVNMHDATIVDASALEKLVAEKQKGIYIALLMENLKAKLTLFSPMCSHSTRRIVEYLGIIRYNTNTGYDGYHLRASFYDPYSGKEACTNQVVKITLIRPQLYFGLRSI